jgi:hypothetical protein
MDISRSLLSQVGGWELRSGGCRQGSSRTMTAFITLACFQGCAWLPESGARQISARCCAFGTVRAQRRTRAKGERKASVLAILREKSLPACAQTGGVSRHVASRPRPHLRRGFSLISRAWRVLLTSCLAHHKSRTGRAVFTVGQSREKRAFGRGDW